MRLIIIFCLLSLFAAKVSADTYHYQVGDEVVGNMGIYVLKENDNFLALAQELRVGFNELVEANRNIDPWIPEAGERIIVPTRYVLPNVKQTGVVVNLAELRLYYFHPAEVGSQSLAVSTYPISVGKSEQWGTPLAETKIIGKRAKPNWYPPKSIRAEHEAKNDPLPAVVPAGPDNPLGDYAIRLGLPGYLIHGTNVPDGIGMRVTHGCIRMHPNGIQQLFSEVKINTPVQIINQPYKVGWHEDQLYIESHAETEEYQKAASKNLTQFVQAVIKQTAVHTAYEVETDWEEAYLRARNKQGMPFSIARRQMRAVGEAE
ncbi:MAG: L,D-transpeptidase family protein [Gammaproteobacteria bacterium]|nr:L,D-transpeptidase family protein [Gammaproteobacteria bacterium]